MLTDPPAPPHRLRTSRWWGLRARATTTVLALAGLLAGSLAVPASSSAAGPAAPPPAHFYGTWSDALSPAPQEAQATMDLQAATGVGLIRQYVFWDRIETSPGQFDWSRTDQLVRDATSRGLRVLPTLLYTPAFYTSKPAGSTSTALFPPQDPQTMARFAEAMVRRYGPGGSYWCSLAVPRTVQEPLCSTPYVPITAWEVWNEPDFPGWWKGKPNVVEYAALLDAVSAGIRRADPDADVLIGALTNGGAAAPGGYLDKLYALGSADDFDVITVNPYALDVAGVEAYVRGARATAVRNGDADKPIVVTEYGWATGGRSRVLVTTEGCQAALLHRATRRLTELSHELGITALIQFQWHDVRTTSDLWPHYAGVVRVDETHKPGLTALRSAIAGEAAGPELDLDAACPAERRPTVALSVSRDGQGEVRSAAPDVIACGERCSAQLPFGSEVLLEAEPHPGWDFAGWSAPACSGTAPCRVKIGGAGQVVTARFEPSATGPLPSPTPTEPPLGRAVGDFDLDGRTDRVVWRSSDAGWYAGGSPVHFGLDGDVAVPGDYDGDGRTDRAVYRPSDGSWHVEGRPSPVFLGGPGDVPVPADYDGDGRTDPAVWRGSDGAWIVAGQPVVHVGLGSEADVPVPADYDGDGRADHAVWRPAAGGWYVRESTTGAVTATFWGLPGDRPVPADFDGNGRAERAVWRADDGGAWLVHGDAAEPVNWGRAGDVPVTGDFDGDGAADRAVWRGQDGGGWYVHGSPDVQHVGLESLGDVPAPVPPSLR